MSPPCELTVQQAEGGYLIRLVGKGTMKQSPAVRDFVLGALEDGARVVLDLSGCEYLDSTFLGCLVLLSRRAVRRESGLEIVAGAEVCRRLFGATHLDKALPIVDQTPKLLGKPVTLPTIELERREFGRHLLETHSELVEHGGPQAETFRALTEQLQRELDEE